LKNNTNGRVLMFLIRCGRSNPKKGDGATSANVTGHQITQINVPGHPGIDLGGQTVTLDTATGIVTTDGMDGADSWTNDSDKTVEIEMKVSGSGTSAVTITYTITGTLTGGLIENPPGDVANPYVITITYTAEEKEE